MGVVSATPLNLEDQIIDAMKKEVYQKMLHSFSQKGLLGNPKYPDDINRYQGSQGKISTDQNMIDLMMEKIKLDEEGWDIFHSGSLRVSI